MRRSLLPSLLLLLLLAVSPLVAEGTAAEEPDLLDALIERSGMAEQLAQFEKLMLEQLHQGLEEEERDDEVDRRIREAVASAYAPGSLENRVRGHLVGGLERAEIERVLEWLDSPLGARITRLEEEAATPESFREQLEVGEWLVSQLAEERRERYRDLDEAVEVSELNFAITVNTILAVAEGLALVSPHLDRPQPEDVRRMVEARREEMTEQMRASTLENFAYTYRELEDAELERYIEFAGSEIGRKYHAAVSEALSQALADAGRDLGLALGPRSAT
jgi:hypothetical protein